MSRWVRQDGEWVQEEDDGGIVRLGKAEGAHVPLEPDYLADRWTKAREMVSHLEDPAPHVQGWDEAIGVYLEDGTKVFALHSDGTVYCPDNSRLPEAAVIFFKEVCKVASLQGYPVRKNPDPSPEGWDS